MIKHFENVFANFVHFICFLHLSVILSIALINYFSVSILPFENLLFNRSMLSVDELNLMIALECMATCFSVLIKKLI